MLQKLLSYTRRAVDHYHMIEAGDRIAVGVSGGKDSLTLLAALAVYAIGRSPLPHAAKACSALRKTIPQASAPAMGSGRRLGDGGMISLRSFLRASAPPPRP